MFKREIITVYNNFEETKRQFETMRSKNIYLIFYEEDIYINILEIPAAKARWIDKIVRNNLIYNFDDIENLCYSYEILDKENGKYRIKVFCINTDKNILYENLPLKCNVSAVYLIQFCYIYYVTKELKERDFILIFNSGEHIYLLFCGKMGVEKNYIFKVQDMRMMELESKIEHLENNRDKTKRNVSIVFINFKFNEIIDKISRQYNVRNLGSIDEKKLIKKYVGAKW